MIDFQVAYDKLAGLESSDEIAGLLLDYGVKGVPSRPTRCAISVWIENQTGDPVLTTPSIIYSQERELPVTEAMLEFIRKFDTNKYPALEKLSSLIGAVWFESRT